MNWRSLIVDEIRRIQPHDLCALDDSAYGLARALLQQGRVQRYLPGAPPQTQFGLALAVDALNVLDAVQARILLGHVRSFISPRILIAADPRCPLDRNAFLALGFERSGHDDTENVALYRFDFNTYKHVPDWLNARHWAHPERWKP
jgi:hypothetical protein